MRRMNKGEIKENNKEYLKPPKIRFFDFFQIFSKRPSAFTGGGSLHIAKAQRNGAYDFGRNLRSDRSRPHLLRKTGNLRQVQKQLGHASPATTANMYADITFEDMQNELNGLYQYAARNQQGQSKFSHSRQTTYYRKNFGLIAGADSLFIS